MTTPLIQVRNAIITSTKLSIDDHGCLMGWLFLDYGGSAQGFGGYAMYAPDCTRGKAPFLEHNFAGHFIWRCCEIGGVGEWEKLADRPIRVKTERTKAHAIGHILEDDWFSPSDDFKAMELGLPLTKEPSL